MDKDLKKVTYGFLDQKSSKVFKETDEGAYKTTNVKLAIQSMQFLF